MSDLLQSLSNKTFKYLSYFSSWKHNLNCLSKESEWNSTTYSHLSDNSACGRTAVKANRYSFKGTHSNLKVFAFHLKGGYSYKKDIMKIYLYNFDPLKPYIIKLGFTGVYIIFLISDQKHRLWVLLRTASLSTHNLKNLDCGYSLELPHWGSSYKYPQSMFWVEV